MIIQPMVVDMFHGDVVVNWTAVRGAGIAGIIHKATQGAGNTDPEYATRRAAAKLAGLLWGAYHFNTGDPVAAQIDHFFSAAQPDADTLMALDWEDNRASQMGLAQACDFLGAADEKLGRPVMVYSGNRAKELLPGASAAQLAILAKRRFWLCEYGPQAKMVDARGRALPWPTPWLWQFTGDGIGPQPHVIAGITTRGIDINSYAGTAEQLTKEWAL
jgi:lysozyme